MGLQTWEWVRLLAALAAFAVLAARLMPRLLRKTDFSVKRPFLRDGANNRLPVTGIDPEPLAALQKAVDAGDRFRAAVILFFFEPRFPDIQKFINDIHRRHFETFDGLVYTGDEITPDRFSALGGFRFIPVFEAYDRVQKDPPEAGCWAVYIPKSHPDRQCFDEMKPLGLAVQGREVPIYDRLAALGLDNLNVLAKQAFERSFPSVEKAASALCTLPDIEERMDAVARLDSFFKIVPDRFDSGYVHRRWAWASESAEILLRGRTGA